MIIEESNYEELNNQSTIHIPLLEEVLNEVKAEIVKIEFEGIETKTLPENVFALLWAFGLIPEKSVL